MVEPYYKEVGQKTEQGRSTKKCKRTNADCKVDILIKAYNEITNEPEQINFLVGLLPDDFYILATNKKLPVKQLEKVYYNNAHIYYNKAKCNFSKYYCYCKIFQKYITDWEKELLIKKLLQSKHAHMVEIACKQIRFLKPYKERLEAGYLAHKLSAIN